MNMEEKFQYKFKLHRDPDALKWKKLDVVFSNINSCCLNYYTDIGVTFITRISDNGTDNISKLCFYSKENEKIVPIYGEIEKTSSFYDALRNAYAHVKFQLVENDDCSFCREESFNKFILYLSFDVKTFHMIEKPDDVKYLKTNPYSHVPHLKSLFHYLRHDLIDDWVHYDMETGDKKKHTLYDMYEYIKNVHDSQQELVELKLNEDELCKYLKSTLRCYQKATVKWMIYRENTPDFVTSDPNDVHPLWQEIKCEENKSCYFNTFTGSITRTRFPSPHLPKGGILAEEMGLGKTVELLACIILNQRPEKYVFKKKKLVTTDKNKTETSEKQPVITTTVTSCSNQIRDVTSLPPPSLDDKIEVAEGVNKNVETPKEKSFNITNVTFCSNEDKIEETNVDEANKCLHVKTHEELVSRDKEEIPTSNKELLNITGANQLQDLQPIETLEQSETGSSRNIDLDPLPSINISTNQLKDLCEESMKANKAIAELEGGESSDNFEVISPVVITKVGLKRPLDEINDNEINPKVNKADILQNNILQNDTPMGIESINTLNNGNISSYNSSINLEEKNQNVNNVLMNHNYSVNELNLHSETVQPTIKNKGNIGNKQHSGKENEFYLFKQKCAMCSTDKDIDFIKCCNCDLVMHKQCYGYEDVDVDEYECPKCASLKVIESHCTLIIVPNTLLLQWVEEIQKHVKHGSLKVKVYEGLRRSPYVHPVSLAQYDIIISSFVTLRAEFHYLHSVSHGKQLRYQKKYIAPLCPLLNIYFWRVCVDEAQMVQNDASRLADMASRIQSQHRWCVSGTPLQKGILDIYGLLLFLGVYPYSIKRWWTRALQDPFKYGDYKPLFDLASKILWRTKKADVLDQIRLPKQTEFITKLKFSPIERHFYTKVQEQSLEKMQQKLLKIDGEEVTVNDLSKKEFDYVIHPLLFLRQACCHPAVVREAHLSVGKTCVTMTQVIEKLTIQEKSDAIDLHRKKICAMNGLAGLHMLLGEFESALKVYKQAVASWEEQMEDVKTDSLQKLHAYHNILEVHKSLGNTLTSNEEDVLQKNMNEIRSKYLENMDSIVKRDEHLLAEALYDTDEANNYLDEDDPWWCYVTRHAITFQTTKDLLTKLRDCITYSHGAIPVIRHSLGFVGTFEFAMKTYLDRSKETRSNILAQLQNLSSLSFQDVTKVSRCCLRPDTTNEKDKNEPGCDFCVIESSLGEYERMLFGGEGYKDNEGNSSGFRSNTDIDFILKTLWKCCKLYNLPKEICDQGNLFIKYMDAVKKEFQFIRSTSLSYYHRIQDLDELEMCTMRINYSFNPEQDISQHHHLIRPGEEPLQKQKFLSDQTIAEMELKKKLSKLTYLQNLAKVQSSNEGLNFETCPICVLQLGFKWSVFDCGHCLCCECFTQLRHNSFARNSSKGPQVQCPICRAWTLVKDVSFVVTKQINDATHHFDSEIEINGDYSTKVAAVLRRIKWILLQDINNKILVFSSWNDVLSLITRSLVENDISCRNATVKSLQVLLEEFKSITSSFNVLLLSHSTGSKGLNIIEATHVILVEPSLNPADELQAIGRVHRIGQKKETFVHRFVIESTVEENMYECFRSKYHSDKDSDVNYQLKLEDLPNLMA